jgi:hypothetical protein
LDNFETFSHKEKDRIIEELGLRFKVELQDKPENFKVIITSREIFQCGFHAIRLEGLILSEVSKLTLGMAASHAWEPPTEQRIQAICKASRGIPLLIMHIMYKIHEGGMPFEYVIKNMHEAGDQLIEFSFKELIEELSNNPASIKIYLLLAHINSALTYSQVIDILNISEQDAAFALAQLVRYQCIDKKDMRGQDTYSISMESACVSDVIKVRYIDVLRDVKNMIETNYTAEKVIEYSEEEIGIIEQFNAKLEVESFSDAENYIEKHLKIHEDSIFIRYYYAKYLKEIKQAVDDAAKQLEIIRHQVGIAGKYDVVDYLLADCYADKTIRDYNRASQLYDTLWPRASEEKKIVIARFYLNWSNSLFYGKEYDPIKEIKRKSDYKSYANKAKEILLDLHERKNSHEILYLLAIANYNIWEMDGAKKYIDRAINDVDDSVLKGEYVKYRSQILNTRPSPRNLNQYI